MVLFTALTEPDQRAGTRLGAVRGLERVARLGELALRHQLVAVVEHRLGFRALGTSTAATEQQEHHDASRHDR